MDDAFGEVLVFKKVVDIQGTLQSIMAFVVVWAPIGCFAFEQIIANISLVKVHRNLTLPGSPKGS